MSSTQISLFGYGMGDDMLSSAIPSLASTGTHIHVPTDVPYICSAHSMYALYISLMAGHQDTRKMSRKKY